MFVESLIKYIYIHGRDPSNSIRWVYVHRGTGLLLQGEQCSIKDFMHFYLSPICVRDY